MEPSRVPLAIFSRTAREAGFSVTVKIGHIGLDSSRWIVTSAEAAVAIGLLAMTTFPSSPPLRLAGQAR